MADIPSEPRDRPAPSVSGVLAKLGGTTTHVSYRNTFPPEPGSTFNFTELGLDLAATELFRTHCFTIDPPSELMNRLQLTWPPLLFETINPSPRAPRASRAIVARSTLSS